VKVAGPRESQQPLMERMSIEVLVLLLAPSRGRRWFRDRFDKKT